MNDVYATITNQIVAALEAGTPPWRKPWGGDHPAGTRPLRSNGIPYRGINVLVLWLAAHAGGYASPFWMTFKQALAFNACVRKGEKGTKIVYADKFKKEVENPSTGQLEEAAIPFLKGYTVFNIEQISGLPEHFYAKPPEPRPEPERIARAEAFFKNTGATIVEVGLQASYSEALNRVRMPPLAFFESPEHFYATLAHEMTHWTRHPTRLERDFSKKKWGDEGYAMEELVAEIGSAFLCADLDISPENSVQDNAAYIAAWLKVLKGDKRAVFTAASWAQAAVDFLHSLQPQEERIAA